NTSVHTSTKFSPFEVVYGRLPHKLPPYIPGTASVQEVDEYLQDRDSLLKYLRKNLLNAQDHMKANVNHHRRDLEFKEGEFVLVKLQPYRQVSVANRLSVKLSPRYYGPYEVLARVGPVAYKIKLPRSSLVHDVFHVSFLRRFIGPLPAAVSELKEVPEPLEIPSDPQPEKILEERVITKGKCRPKTKALENRDHAGQMNASGKAKPYLKLFFPRFSGEDPQGWVYQAEQYFEFQKVAEGDRIALASFHLDGIALQWHRWYTKA
nr:transposon Ty3-G Gag-Pol polyprotein [Tanacetum cinerariifolium]